MEKITKEILLEEIKKRQGRPYNPRPLVRNILDDLGIANKRGWYLLSKLGDKYEWGVSIDTGWLTEQAFNLGNKMKTDKKIEKQIKKIIDEYSYFLGDADEYNFNMPKVIEQLTNYIKERERKAIDGFVEYIADRYYLDMDMDLTVDGNIRDMEIGYLQTLEDKDENR